MKVDPNVQAVVNPPKRVPLAIRDKLKVELELMEELGVIAKQTDSNPWVNDMATAMKPNHKMRLCIDPQHLNKAILREHYPLR